MFNLISRILWVVLLCLVGNVAFTQNQIKADSIERIINSKKLTKSENLEAYFWLTTHSSSPEKRIKYAEQLLSLSKEANNLEYQIKAKCRLGLAYRFAGDLDKALEYLFESANQAADIDELKVFLAEIYAEISTCYTQNGDSENALLYGAKTISILRGTNQKQELALTLLNNGYDYYLIGRYDSAMAYYNESEPILQDIGMTIGLAYIKGNRALVFWKKGDPEKAKKDLFAAIEMLEPFGDNYAMADYYNQIGNIFLEEKAFNKVIEFSSKSYDISVDEEFKEQARDASNLLYQSYKAQGNYEKALEYQTEYHSYKDSIQNLETTQYLANLRTEFEVGRKQVEIDLLLEQKRSHQIIMITGGIILLITIILVVTIYVNYRSKIRLNKQLEEQKNSLITLNQTKDKFFSIISHDLRGPVGTLIGLVDVARYFVKEGKKENILEMVDNMGVLVKRVNKLLENLLSWALQQSGHFPYVPEEISIKSIMENVIETSNNTAISKNIKLNTSIDKDFELYVDRNATLTILRNLVNNGVKFTSSGGQVDIGAEIDTENNFGVITVSDNGVGIPKEKLDNLFKLNEKISTPGTSGETGIGLGLQLVFDFVKLNKGKVNVKSEVNKGTTFTVSLPLAQQ
ncbi:tetratricopeptide repeat-containing sensor histidine kinase [Ekhidna sp.]